MLSFKYRNPFSWDSSFIFFCIFFKPLCIAPIFCHAIQASSHILKSFLLAAAWQQFKDRKFTWLSSTQNFRREEDGQHPTNIQWGYQPKQFIHRRHQVKFIGGQILVYMKFFPERFSDYYYFKLFFGRFWSINGGEVLELNQILMSSFQLKMGQGKSFLKSHSVPISAKNIFWMGLKSASMKKKTPLKWLLYHQEAP